MQGGLTSDNPKKDLPPALLLPGRIRILLFCGDDFESEFSFLGPGYPSRELVSETNSWFFDQMVKYKGRKNRQQQEQRKVYGSAEVLHRRQLTDDFKPRITRVTENVDHNREVREVDAIAIARRDSGSSLHFAPWNLTKQGNRQAQAEPEAGNMEWKVCLSSRQPS